MPFKKKRLYAVEVLSIFSIDDPESTFPYTAVMLSSGCGSYYMRMLHRNLCEHPICRIGVKSTFIPV